MNTEKPFRTRVWAAVACLVANLAIAAPVTARPAIAGPAPASQGAEGRAASAYAALPLHFEPNVGQTDERVRFLARGRGYTVYVTGDEVVLGLAGGRAAAPTAAGDRPRDEARPPASLRMRFAGARQEATLAAERAQPGRVNYLSGSDPQTWRRGVPTYGAVRWSGIYPGVDAVFYGNQERLEYDLVVAPGADPRQIRVAFDGQSGVEVDGEGNLVLSVRGSAVKQLRPFAFQQVQGGKREVRSRYTVAGGEVGFELDGYDRSKPLVIDPVLVYDVFLGGGESNDTAADIAVDASGAAYVVGLTNAMDFPVTPGAFDAVGATLGYSGYDYPESYVVKISPDGSSLVYATYLGGSERDQLRAIAVDATGAAVVAGESSSNDYPVTPNALDGSYNGGAGYYDEGDAVVTKLSPDGSSILYSTYLGSQASDAANAVVVDGEGAIHVAGFAGSSGFPTSAGAFDTTFNSNGSIDGFLLKIDAATGGLVYSTFLGGYGYDEALALAVDATGAAVIAGTTVSLPDFPTTAGAFDAVAAAAGQVEAFVAKFAPAGDALAFSTFLGGSGDDSAAGLAIDAAGAIYVTGATESNDFPTTAGAFDTTHSVYYEDAFVTKLSPNGATLGYSTYLGGEYSDRGHDIAVDGAGIVYVVGFTSSVDFPTTAGAIDTTFDSVSYFATRVGQDGTEVLSSTFVGEWAYPGEMAIAVDAEGALYLAATTNRGSFPTTPGSFDPDFNGGVDGVVLKLNPAANALVYGAFVSGKASPHSDSEDTARDVAVDAAGCVYVVGSTGSASFPHTPGAPDSEYSGYEEAFVTKLGPDGGLVYSTFLGGWSYDVANGVAVGPDGSAYVTGWTRSYNFPTTPGSFDTTGDQNASEVFVSRLSPDGGSLVYSTLLGGSYEEMGHDLAVGSDGSAYVVGETRSTDFPTTSGAVDTTHDGYGTSDAFVVRLNAGGNALLYSTFYGAPGDDRAFAVAINSAGQAFVTGETFAPSFPTSAGAFDQTFGGHESREADGFVSGFDASGGALLYSSYLGGWRRDVGYDLVALDDGTVYVAGLTQSNDYPTTADALSASLNGGNDDYASDGFVTRVAANGGSVIYSTYFGGQSMDLAAGIALDASGRVTIAGETVSINLPTTPGAFDTTLNDGQYSYSFDGFVARFEPGAGALLYSTYLGGAGNEHVLGLAVGGGVYVAGSTDSTDFSLDGHGARDRRSAFVVRLDVPTAPAPGSDTPGYYVRSQGQWFLRNESSQGPSDVVFYYGAVDSPFEPLTGDWDGDGVDTPGLYDPSSGAFFLTNQLTGGPADFVFYFGAGTANGGSEVVPLVGDWDGDGADTVGLYVLASGVFYLRNAFANGPADETFYFGPGGPGYQPLAGDWDGDGTTTVGLYVAAAQVFFLRNANANGPADVTFTYGPPGAIPVVGDWDGDGTTTVGAVDTAAAGWFLKNSNGNGPADVAFGYGPPGAEPIVGNWDGQ